MTRLDYFSFSLIDKWPLDNKVAYLWLRGRNIWVSIVPNSPMTCSTSVSRQGHEDFQRVTHAVVNYANSTKVATSIPQDLKHWKCLNWPLYACLYFITSLRQRNNCATSVKFGKWECKLLMRGIKHSRWDPWWNCTSELYPSKIHFLYCLSRCVLEIREILFTSMSSIAN